MSEKQNILETFVEHQQMQILQTTDIQDPSLLLAHGSQQVIDLERYLPAPRRIRINNKFDDLRGIIDYTKDFATERTRAFISNEKITVIFDYHTKEDPAHCSHTAYFCLSESARWKLWSSINNQWIEQKKFADFLDSGLEEIADPNQATILDMVKNFRATNSYEFDSQTTEFGGSSLTYRKILKTGTTNTEQVQIPDRLKINLQPFENVNLINDRITDDNKKIPVYQFQALLKWIYDEDSGKVFFKLQIINIENAFDETLQKVLGAFQDLSQVKCYLS